MAASRDKAAELKAYEQAVEKAARGEKVDLHSIRVRTRLEQQEFNNRVAQKRTSYVHQKQIADGTVKLQDIGTLSRQSSDILRGKTSSRNPAGLPSRVQRQVRIGFANRDFIEGRISYGEYQGRVKQVTQDVQATKQMEDQHRMWSSSKKAQGAALKEAQHRADAASVGVAVGSIQKDGSNASSIGSQVSKGKVGDFKAQTTSPPATQSQRDNKVKVTTPDGKERVFKDRARAEKFVSRVDGNYKVEVQGPTKPNQNEGEVLGFSGINQVLMQQKSQTPNIPPTLTQYADSKPKQQRQDYPRDYQLSDITFENVSRGFWEGGILPLTQLVLLPKPIFADILGRTKEEEEQIRSAINTVKRVIPDKPVASGAVIEQAFTGKPITGTGEGLGYDVGSLSFDVALAAVPARKFPIPVKISKFKQPGVTLYSTKINPKIKTPIGTPKLTTRPVQVSSVELGFGTKTKPVLSKVGSKITLGEADLGNITVKTTPTTPKQIQRGVKMAADSTKFEQITSRKIIPKITGIDDDSKEKARIIEEIIDITTKPKKDTKVASSLPDDAFSSITQSEQQSLLTATRSGQKKLINPIGTYEGSLSQGYFVLPKYLRKFGDVDLHASSYPKAARQIKYIDPKLQADPGRKFISVTNDKTKSAKEYIIDEKGRKEKIIEILNPEEVDEKGIGQSIEGDTIFGKKIPKTTYKVDEGKTYGRQRQILKKGESLYSIQVDSSGRATLGPASFRKEKDVSDFYALAESARVTEFAEGSKESIRLKELLSRFKKMQDFDVDDYLAKNRIKSEPVNLTIEKSTLQKIKSPSSLSSISKSSTSSSVSLLRSKSSVPSIVSKPKSLSSIVSKPKSLTPKSITSKPYSPPRSITPKSQTKSPLSLSKSLIGKSQASQSLGGKSLGGKSATSKSLGGKSITSKSITSLGNKPTYRTTTKKIIPAAIIPIQNRTQPQRPSPKKPRVDFLGNTRVAEITGFRTKKTSISYGKKTQKLYDDDLKKTKRKSKITLKTTTKNLLGKPKKIRL